MEKDSKSNNQAILLVHLKKSRGNPGFNQKEKLV